MKKYSINKIDENIIQITGEITGIMKRNKNGINNLNHYDFSYQYFNDGKLIKINGVCRNVNHLIEKIENKLKPQKEK